MDKPIFIDEVIGKVINRYGEVIKQCTDSVVGQASFRVSDLIYDRVSRPLYNSVHNNVRWPVEDCFRSK